MLHESADRRCEASDIAKSKSFETGTRRERCESSSDRASFSTKASLRAHNTRSRRLVQERQGHWIASQLAHCSTGLDCFRIVSHSAVADQHQHVAQRLRTGQTFDGPNNQISDSLTSLASRFKRYKIHYERADYLNLN